ELLDRIKSRVIAVVDETGFAVLEFVERGDLLGSGLDVGESVVVIDGDYVKRCLPCLKLVIKRQAFGVVRAKGFGLLCRVVSRFLFDGGGMLLCHRRLLLVTLHLRDGNEL